MGSVVSTAINPSCCLKRVTLEGLEDFKNLLYQLSLDVPILEKEQLLAKLAVEWDKHAEVDVSPVLKGNSLYQTIAEVFGENNKNWVNALPSWFSLFAHTKAYPNSFPNDQTSTLVQKVKQQVMEGHYIYLRCLSSLVSSPLIKQTLLLDEPFYSFFPFFHILHFFNLKKDKLKEADNEPCVPLFLAAATYGCDEWQFRLINDKNFILKLLNYEEREFLWFMFMHLSQHPDAKSMLPCEVLLAASKQIPQCPLCTGICALLCSDDDLPNIQLSTEWINQITEMLKSLVSKGTAKYEKIYASLLDVILPIANLSGVDSFKETLGQKAVELLLKVVTEKLPDGRYVQPYLKRGKQEASRALWNFAFYESNRVLIRSITGMVKLTATLAQTDDPIVKQNISGVLLMLAPLPFFSSTSTPNGTSTSCDASQKHIMISYNWGNQPTVKRMAKSLQERGYNVWLDIERMDGSTLEAMAQAIEQSELVLICMSQKYKDSPNCRLEGEYCVNRKVKFLPLMMQKGYKPDGWLGIALGAKLYYDFTEECNWEHKMTELVKAIGENGKLTNSPISPRGIKPVQQPINVKSAIEWTTDDMLVWMKVEHISHHYDLFQDQNFTGRALLELKNYATSHPEVFVQVCEKMGISAYGDILELSAALRKLQ